MSDRLPQTTLVCHGETAWSLSGQHTGLTDVPLTPRGEENALRLVDRLRGQTFARVCTSPLQRARQTCELAGFGSSATVDADLVEWNYGQYEGLTTAEIRQRRPGWDLFRDGCPSGEQTADVGARADRVIARLRAVAGDVLVFSSGHILRVLAARWCGLDPAVGRMLYLGTAAVSILGYDRALAEPVLRLWNDRGHVSA